MRLREPDDISLPVGVLGNGEPVNHATMSLKLFSISPPARSRFLLNLLGVLVLVVGLGSAISIWLDQDRIDRQTSARENGNTGPLSPDDSRRYTHDVEMYYGQTGLLMDKWMRWLGGLTRGKSLAKIIGVVSLVVASWVFYTAAKQGPERHG